jgi:hypothetical protein
VSSRLLRPAGNDSRGRFASIVLVSSATPGFRWSNLGAQMTIMPEELDPCLADALLLLARMRATI